MTEAVSMMIESIDKVVGDEAKSKKIAWNVLDAIGGVQIYLPRPDAAFKEDRDKEIYESFDGTNMIETCRKYNMNFKAVYRACHRYQKRLHASKPKKPAVPGELFEM